MRVLNMTDWSQNTNPAPRPLPTVLTNAVHVHLERRSNANWRHTRYLLQLCSWSMFVLKVVISKPNT